MAEWGIQRFDDDLEVKENRDTVPAFKKIIERCKPLAGEENKKKATTNCCCRWVHNKRHCMKQIVTGLP